MAINLKRVAAAYEAFVTERFALPTEAQVQAIEQRMGVTLPPDYRQFVLEYNGAWFSEPDMTPSVPDCPADCLTVLYGIGASDASAELASPADLALFDDNDPVEVLPIGYTLMGNMLLLVTHPEGRGSIILKKAYSQDSYFMAAGIDEFAGLLQEPPPDDEE